MKPKNSKGGKKKGRRGEKTNKEEKVDNSREEGRKRRGEGITRGERKKGECVCVCMNAGFVSVQTNNKTFHAELVIRLKVDVIYHALRGFSAT